MTIFTSAFARGDAVPSANRSHRGEPRATVTPIGDDGRFGDTIEFEKIRAVDFSAGQCYLPWCREDFGPDTEPSHIHFGYEKRIETFIHQGGGKTIENGRVRLQLDQCDDDIPGGPIAGDPTVLLQVEESCSLSADAVYMTLETALALGQQIIGIAQVGLATRGMPNPNEADPAEMLANEAARRVRWADEDAKREAKDAAKLADDDAKAAKYETPHWIRTVAKANDIGRNTGKSWFGRRCPRLALIFLLATHRADMHTQILFGFLASGATFERDSR
jgi:hypothetical protein